MLRFTILASGSEGNALVVECGSTRILVDCGLGSAREVERRLLQRGLQASDLSAIVITHEHADHIGCTATLARRHHLPVFATWGTLNAWRDSSRVERLCPFDNHAPFAIGDLSITPIPVPHDAREPSQFLFGDGQLTLGLLTDLGCSTTHITRQLTGCNALILEANHDTALLQSSSYPPHLKRRIQGDYGHLSNHQAAELLASIDSSRLQHLVAAHLSQENNRPHLARAALAESLGCAEEWIAIADQHQGLEWRSVS